MTIAVREPSPAGEPVPGVIPVHHGEVCPDSEESPQAVLQVPASGPALSAIPVLPGPTHCGVGMAISSGATGASMQWTSVEPIWPEWACGCGFRMDIDARDPVSSVWIAAERWQSLEHELAVARNTFQLAFTKAVESGVERDALAKAVGVVPSDIENLLP
ncbi:hypothetical protein AAHB33_18975 [Paenarthrobacter sp. S56]|uniref:hypothetical protein n=1 Tax=Paenarthrobacter sp. S56 TaxID=3138179 RepID=UPI00321AD5B4